MALSWFLFASLGMVTARYAKNIDKNLFGKKLWFRIHQLCMITTWLLTIVGVVLIFIEKKTVPLEINSINRNPHGLVGLITAILAFIQPFLAFLRPDPNSSKRWIFNYGHFSIGTISMILAVFAIFLVNGLDSMKIDSETGVIVCIIFSVIYVTVHLVSTLVTIFIKNQAGKNLIIKFMLIFITLTGIACASAMIYLIFDQ